MRGGRSRGRLINGRCLSATLKVAQPAGYYNIWTLPKKEIRLHQRCPRWKNGGDGHRIGAAASTGISTGLSLSVTEPMHHRLPAQPRYKRFCAHKLKIDHLMTIVRRWLPWRIAPGGLGGGYALARIPRPHQERHRVDLKTARAAGGPAAL